MQYTTLGESGLVVSRLCFGAMTFGSGSFHGFEFNVEQDVADRMVGLALDGGVNFFDTADMYASGQSEEILGRALGERRRDVVIATKCASRQGQAPTRFGLSAGHVIAACEASLRRLGTDYIDLYQVHFDDRVTPLPETLRALEDLAATLELTHAELAALDEVSAITPTYPGWMYARGPSDPIARQVARR